MKLKFYGAAGTVTGSRTLLQHLSTSVMVDCGLFQGPKPFRLMNWEGFHFAPNVQAVFLTHAHLDHVGALPILMRDGFNGPVFCTPGTRDVAELILLDSGRLQEEDAEFANRSGYSHHKPAQPLYTEADVQRVLGQFRVVERNEWLAFGDLKVRFQSAGHIVGSNFIEVEFSEGKKPKRLVFSGDLGGGRSLIMRERETPERADYLVIESTYGHRNLPEASPVEEMQKILNQVLPYGRVLIPAFSVGRTQDVLHIIGQLIDTGSIPQVPVFLNSPMSIRATEIYARHTEDLKPEAVPLIPAALLGIFKAVSSVEESERLVKDAEGKIIVSASGMLTGGRVMHHLKEILPDPKSAVLFVGYQAAETKGRLLIDGINELRIHHKPHPVRCRIESLQSLSSHADQQSLTQWITSFANPETQVFLNHGEPDSLFGFKKHLETTLKLQVSIPAQAEEFTLGS